MEFHGFVLSRRDCGKRVWWEDALKRGKIEKTETRETDNDMECESVE